jgi:hypothetical protein
MVFVVLDKVLAWEMLHATLVHLRYRHSCNYISSLLKDVPVRHRR